MEKMKSIFKEWFKTELARSHFSRRCWTVIAMHEIRDIQKFRNFLDRVQDVYQIISLSEGFKTTQLKKIKRPLLTLTFDDADRTVYENCLPEIRRRALPACLFVCTGYVAAGFRDTPEGPFAVMTWEQLKEWRDAGLEIGGHTANHIPLYQATLERAQWEIMECKRMLEERLNCEATHFAYPYGHFTDALHDWLEMEQSIQTVSTMIPIDNYPGFRGKHIYRKTIPRVIQNWKSELRNRNLYETVRGAYHRKLLNNLSPVLWQMESGRPTAYGGYGQ